MKYIDLGLPSGTKWAEENIEGYYTFDEAVEKYSDALPTKEQFEELQGHCKWEWTGDGYKITGPNGNSITLPAEGYRNTNGRLYLVGYYGYYWSSTPNGSDIYRCYGLSVRLVKNTNNDMENKEINIAEMKASAESRAWKALTRLMRLYITSRMSLACSRTSFNGLLMSGWYIRPPRPF